MYDQKFYIKLVCKIISIVLLAIIFAFSITTQTSYTLAAICLFLIIIVTASIIYSVNRMNDLICSFFDAFRNNDFTNHYPAKTKEVFYYSLHNEMNRITSLFRENQLKTEEKQLYYEAVIQVLAHEIRNIITPITSLSADLLNHFDVYNQKELKESIQLISDQSQCLTLFVNAYHRLTHLPEPIRQKIKINNLFVKLNKLLQSETDNRSLQFVISEDITIWGDENLIILALTNLIKNALQAIETQANGYVIVEATQEQTCFLIKVTDNGPGIPQKLTSAIFTPFFSTKKGGSGIGLSIALRIMQLHNGKLTVSSHPSVKTEFILTFQKPSIS